MEKQSFIYDSDTASFSGVDNSQVVIVETPESEWSDESYNKLHEEADLSSLLSDIENKKIKGQIIEVQELLNLRDAFLSLKESEIFGDPDFNAFMKKAKSLNLGN